MEDLSYDKIEQLLYESTLGMLRFDPEAQKDEQGNWKPLDTWSKADASCITEVKPTRDKNGNPQIKLKFVTRKSVIKTAKQVLKGGPPRQTSLQKIYEEIKDLVAAETK